MSKTHQITIRLNDKEYKMLLENMKLQQKQCDQYNIRCEMSITNSISKAIFTENHYLRKNIIWKD